MNASSESGLCALTISRGVESGILTESTSIARAQKYARPGASDGEILEGGPSPACELEAENPAVYSARDAAAILLTNGDRAVLQRPYCMLTCLPVNGRPLYGPVL
jgi:hypothetical protein